MMKAILLLSFFIGFAAIAQTAPQEQLYTFEQLEKIKMNSLKPVLYGIGAAGVTFDMTQEDVSKLLAPPYLETNEGTAYPEGVYIIWNAFSKKPDYMMVFETYLGEIQTSDQKSSFRIKNSFSKDYSVNLRGAQKLAKDLYSTFEKNSKKTSCISEGLCKVHWGDDAQKDFYIELPGLILMFSKDRFTLYRLLIKK